MSDNDLTRRAFVGTSAAIAVAALETSRGTRVLRHLGPHRDRLQREVYEGIEELSITDLRAGMQAGTYTARSLVEQYLARIESLDQKGPALNHVIELNPDALMIADQRDTERKSGASVGPLHGIPIHVKDIIEQ